MQCIRTHLQDKTHLISEVGDDRNRMEGENGKDSFPPLIKAAYRHHQTKLEDIHTRCHTIYSFFTFYREDNPILDK